MQQPEFNFEQSPTPSVSAIVRALKVADQDFEWYPTTNEMLDAVISDVRKLSVGGSLLDVGCGDGRALLYLQEHAFYQPPQHRPDARDKMFHDLYGIEKSQIHLKALVESKSINIVGTDFSTTNFINKQTDVLFCNPPYSEFTEWLERILSTGFAKLYYFVIPQRWKNNSNVKEIMRQRGLAAEVIYQGDFLEAERQARAKIDVVRFYFKEHYSEYEGTDDWRDRYSYNSRRLHEDSEANPFDHWFNGFFDSKAIEEANKATSNEKENAECREIFAKSHSINELEMWYCRDLEKLQKTYQAVAQIDPILLSELNVEVKTIKDSVKARLEDLSKRYWKNFLDFYEPITSRLTKNSRERLYKSVLQYSKMLDFTVANMIFITERAIAFSENYLQEQVKDVYLDLANPDCMVAYKSNQRLFEHNDYRYNRDTKSAKQYKLDYRIITRGATANWEGKLDFGWNNRYCRDRINDICIVLRTLGFNAQHTLDVYQYNFGEVIQVNYTNLTTGERDIAFDLKFYKNGNMHIRFNKKIMLALNVVAGKLFGWVRTAQEAAEEMGEELKEVNEVFNCNDRLRIECKPLDNALPHFH